jgi:hypothetical protein
MNSLANKNMTGDQILQKFSSMIDDNLDEDFLLQLANDAKDEVEAVRVWEKLKRELAVTVTAGLSFTTPLASLPTGFIDSVSLSDSHIRYTRVSFDDRAAKENSGLGYFIDLFNEKLHLCGTNNAAASLSWVYTASSPDITASTEWIFPERFHQIIPLKMAELYYAIDGGEKGRAWDDRWKNQFDLILGSMERWDARIKVASKRRTRCVEGEKSIC